MNPVKKQLQRIGHRLHQRSPVIYRRIKRINEIAFLLTGLPEILSQVKIFLPQEFSILENKFVAIVNLIIWLTCSLTVEKDKQNETKK
jgi:hypothetical protein